MEQLGYHWTDFHEVLYFGGGGVKSVDKIQVSLRCDNSNGYFTRIPMYLCDKISLNPYRNEKCCRQKSYRKSKHTFCVQQLFFENRTVYEKMWKNIVKRDRPQKAIWRMRIACWIPKATDTHSGGVIFIALPLPQRLHERPSMLRGTYVASLVSSTPQQPVTSVRDDASSLIFRVL